MPPRYPGQSGLRLAPFHRQDLEVICQVARTGALKAQRVSLRVEEEEDRALFDLAAATSRETLTQFLVAGGRERAERLLADRTRFQLSPDAWDELVAIMDRDAKPNPKLARLFSRPDPG
jgi:uncharacterized protein (DUF1778 family)